MATEAELKLLSLAVRASFDPSARPALAKAADAGECRALPRLAERHRVEGLVWDGICQSQAIVPIDAQRRLASRAEVIAANSLLNASTCHQLSRAFAKAGVAILFLKGTALAQLVYPRPHAKDSCDIDILVDADDLAQAAKILSANGFSLAEPKRVNQLRWWHIDRKESVWLNAGRQIQLDLHTRPIDNPNLSPSLCALSVYDEVKSATGDALAIYNEDQLYAYLCLHGASSAWFRLKWLSDLAAYLHLKEPPAIVELHRAAMRLGAGMASGQGLLLTYRLFDTSLPGALLDELKNTPCITWLAAIAWDQLLNDQEPTERHGGTVPIRLSQCLLGPSIGFAVGELARQAREIMSRP